jgi:hypothetical protein
VNDVGSSISARSLRSEARRNLESGTTRALLLGMVWCVLLSGLLVWNVAVTADLLQSARGYQDAGASVTVVDAAGRIDGQQCASLAALPNVRGAGALRADPAPLTPAVTPGVELPTFEATPGLIGILLPDARERNGIFLSDAAADALGAGRTPLALGDRSVDIAGTFPYPEDGRRPLLGYSVVETVPDAGTFDQCWVAVWPESPRVQSIAGSAVVVDEDAGQGPPTVGQLNSSLGRTFDGEASYRNRATAFLPGALVLVGVSLGFLAVRMRRLELAAARLIGIRPSDQGVMLLMESGAWIAAASIISLVLTLAASVAMTGGLLPSGLEFAVIAVLAGGVGVVCGVLGEVASISSRRALRYFRDR